MITHAASRKQYTVLLDRPETVSFYFGADDGARTRYLHLGKVALYQMSYIRKWCLRSESNQRHEDFQSSALPTELQRQKEKWRPGTGSNRRPLA